MKKQAALYARVSSAEQVDGHSLDFQIADMKAAAKRDGFAVASVYRDEGVSAKSDRRPEFQRMIAEAKAGRFQRIYVWKFDRFARNREDSAIYKGLLRRSGVQVVSVKEPTDPDSPSSVILEGVLDVMAEWYSADLKQKMGRAKRHRADNGLYNGDLPFGYSKACGHERCTVKDCSNNMPVPVRAEAQAVREAFTRYGDGRASFAEIAEGINALGFKTRNKRKSTAYGLTGPRPFTKDSVRDMISNPFYAGRVRYRGETRDGKHEAIVSRELWEQCAAIRLSRSQRPRSWSAKFRPYLLKGLARCADCGERLWASTAKGVAYYAERSKARGIDCASGGGSIRVDVLDGNADAMIRDLSLPRTWQRHILDLYGGIDERMKAERERQSAAEKLKRLSRVYLDGGVTRGEYEIMKAELEARVNAVVEPIEKDMLDAGRMLERIGVVWPDMTTAERHAVLSDMMEAVYVDVPAKRVVGVAAKPSFRALLKACEGSVRPAQGAEPGESDTGIGDPEGIRTLDLHRDRVAC